MTSSSSGLTTLFVVGPDEYVEFNESMGSKAFLEHVWDQSKTPLKNEETSASGTYLHSAGARISPDPPPRIEFPTILRNKGKGNSYKSTGRWISWDELKVKNPLALIDPPSLEEYIRKGGNVGSGEKVEAGGWLKGEKRFKVVKRKKEAGKFATLPESDDWIGGSVESIYAAPTMQSNAEKKVDWHGGSSESIYASHAKSPSEETDSDGWLGGSSTSTPQSKPRLIVKGVAQNHANQARLAPENAEVLDVAPKQLRKSRSGLSLSERLGMDDLKEASKAEPMPKLESLDNVKSETDIEKNKEHRSRPPKLELLDRREAPPSLATSRTPIAQTPLSATHPPPETPLKHIWRGQNRPEDIPPTPNTEAAVNNATSDRGTGRLGGLLLNPGDGSNVLPKELQTPLRESFPTGTSDDAPAPPPSMQAAKSQIDQMLARLRLARTAAPAPSGGGTQASRWAIKEADPPALNKTLEKSIEVKESKDATPMEIPTAPRALREAQESVKVGPASQSSISTKAPKSLLDRISPATCTSPEESSKTVKGKKERKRGSRKADLHHEEATAPVEKPSTLPAGEDISADVVSSEGDKTPVSMPHPDPIPSASLVQEQPSKEVAPITGLAEKEVALSPTLAPSTSMASIATEPSMEGSNVGNDTLTSINWADDDDDDTMPELPEEWTRGSQAAAAPETFSAPPTTLQSAFSRGTQGEESDKSGEMVASTNGAAKRGSKRGGKGRGRKEKDDEVRQGSLPSNAPRGLRIAGSASAVNGGRGADAIPSSAPAAPKKELFPAYTTSNEPPRGPRIDRGHDRNATREQMAHGRPKLMASNKEAFTRLTKGAIGISADPSVGAGQDIPHKARKSGGIGGSD